MEAIEAAGVGAATKRSVIPIIVAIVAGVVGSLAAVAALGRGTYDVAPFRVELRVTPAFGGTTTLGMEAAAVQQTGTAEANTHAGALAFEATIVGIDTAGIARAVLTRETSPSGPVTTTPVDPSNPHHVAQYLAQNAKTQARNFGIKVGAIALAGGFAASLLLSMGRWKRAIAGAIAGVAVLGILGLVAQQTYDTSKFQGTTFGTRQ